MPIYNVDEQSLASQLLPPNKRQPIYGALTTDWLSGMQRCNDIFNDYINGFVSATPYSSSLSYARGALVIAQFLYGSVVYESQQDGNTGNQITDTDWWQPVSPNFIGVEERTSYSCSRVLYEWALNRWFGTTFRQPTAIGTDIYSPLSDIYILTNYIYYGVFHVGLSEISSSAAGPYGSNAAVPLTNTASTAGTDNFTIYVPGIVYSSLPGYSGPGTVDNLIRRFADTLCCYGLNYNIVVY